MTRAVLAQQAEQGRLTQAAMAQQAQMYSEAQAMLAQSFANLTHHGLDQPVMQPQRRLDLEPALLPPPGSHNLQSDSQNLPPGMRLRLAAAGIGLPQGLQETPQTMTAPQTMTTLQIANHNQKMEQIAHHNQVTPKSESHDGIYSNPKSESQDGSVLYKKDHNSLRSFLEEDLVNVDKRCIFTCRRINKLGFKSKDVLEQHFSQFGEVVEVFVTHPRSKPDVPGAPPKFRPGNFGIVVMKTPEAVQRILAEGSEQRVRHVQVRVTMFEAKGEADTKYEGALPPEPLLSPSIETEARCVSPKISSETGQASSYGTTTAAGSGSSGVDSNGSGHGGSNRGMTSSGPGSGSAGSAPGSGSGGSGSGGSGGGSNSGSGPGSGSDEDEGSNPGSGSAGSGEGTGNVLTAPSAVPMTVGQSSQMVQDACGGNFSQDPKKVAVQAVEGGTQFHFAQCLRKEAERLLLQADVMLAVAHETTANMTPGSEVPAIANPVQTTNMLPPSFQRPTVGNQSYPPLPPGLAPFDWRDMPTQQPVSTAMSEISSQDANSNGTLSSHLMEVSAEDPSCVFVARQIHKLGFQSRERLRQHFSQYGKVVRVLVADKRVKTFSGPNGQRKTRPGGLGLIVMRSPSSVRRVLGAGGNQLVCGHWVAIQPYDGPKTALVDNTDANSTTPSTTPSRGSGSRHDEGTCPSPEMFMDTQGV